MFICTYMLKYIMYVKCFSIKPANIGEKKSGEISQIKHQLN